MDLLTADAEILTDECISKIRTCADAITNVHNCLPSATDEETHNGDKNNDSNFSVTKIHTSDLNEVGDTRSETAVLQNSDVAAVEGVHSTCSTERNQEDMRFPVKKFCMETNSFGHTNGLKPSKLSDSKDSTISNEKECDWELDVKMLEENIEKENMRSEFIPTIIEIRGSCTNDLDREISVVEKTTPSSSLLSNEVNESSIHKSESSEINIVDVQGNFNHVNSGNPGSNDQSKLQISEGLNPYIIYSADEDSGSVTEDHHTPYTDVRIKEEPRDTVADNASTFNNAECGSTCFTSEIIIEDEKLASVQNEDTEVYCLEPAKKTPSPIPIKTESRIDNENTSSLMTTSRQALVNSCRKRTSKPQSSKDKDCHVVSSGSDKDDSSDSHEKFATRKRNCAFSAADYACHLCNTAFQEHELLNEHMILHRNNSLIEAKAQGRPKTKVKNFTCSTCHKRLSTWQSLQQHTMIHNNEKPHVCHVCKKDFRHLSNYKMHLQKHKDQEPQCDQDVHKYGDDKHTLDKSVVRGVDFGRLVGPLFMKETLLNQKNERLASAKKVPTSVSPQERPCSYPRYLYEPVPPSPTLSNKSKEFLKRNYSDHNVEAGKAMPDDDVVPLKSFNRIENIVMNAARFIVKLDNVDANVLKRKIKTPDISIERGVDKKRRIVSLSPLAKNHRLDEIENIVIADTYDDPPASDADEGHCRETGRGNCGENIEESIASKTRVDDSRFSHQETLTDNELLELLNDDKGIGENRSVISNSKSLSLHADEKKKVTSPQKIPVSNTIPSNETRMCYDRREILRENVNIYDNTVSLLTSDTDDEEEWQTDDLFDGAFHKVVLRRLAWLCKRAAENDGKLDRRFLLGPRFWRKAIRRAESHNRKNDLLPETSPSSSLAPMKRSAVVSDQGCKLDDNRRRTNDPIKLQSRAEYKLKCVLNKLKVADNPNGLDLLGPLFWRRTLKLAGVRRGDDLKMYLNDIDGTLMSSTFGTIEFVDSDQLNVSNEVSFRSASEERSNETVNSIHTSAKSDVQLASNFLDGILNNELLHPTENDSSSNEKNSAFSHLQSASNDVEHTCPSSVSAFVDGSTSPTKFDSILYESLTKPRNRNSNCSSLNENKTVESIVDVDDSGVTTLCDGKKLDPKLSTRLAERYKVDMVSSDNDEEHAVIAESTPVNTINDKLILNVDGQDFQLLTQPLNNDKNIVSEESNYVLLSDETGAMQYVVNVQAGEGGFANFDLIGNPSSGQLAYAIQFEDGSGSAASTADQLMPMPVQMEMDETKLKLKNLTSEEKPINANPKHELLPTKFVNSTTHVGKELSDFLNLHYVESGEKGDASIASA